VDDKHPRNVIPPTLTMVAAYCAERRNNVDPENFCDFYESKNWYVGNQKMKDWQASVRTWEKKTGGRNVAPPGHVPLDERPVPVYKKRALQSTAKE
jgi:hypothetical protein